MNTKLAAYYLKYSEKIYQVCQPTDLTVQASIPSGTCMSQMAIGMTQGPHDQ